MIAHLHGRLAHSGADHAVIDVNGVGYLVGASAKTLVALAKSDGVRHEAALAAMGQCRRLVIARALADALDAHPALMKLPEEPLLEPLAAIYLHLDPDDLEDADALLEEIESLEPPADLEEAVEGLVSAVLMLADVSRPVRPQLQTGAGRAGPAARFLGAG